MKPIAIFQHSVTQGPGYLAAYLDAKNLPWQLFRMDEGDAVPSDPHAFAGLAFLGGPMSANDDLPWIAPLLDLIRAAVDADIPCVGHCLGGQLMAKALGGTVSRAPRREIGWGKVQVADTPLARDWFGPLREFLAFHWHGEEFSIPAGASVILSSPYCANQAFVLGKHLGLQCHVEMTPALVRAWCEAWGEALRKHASDSVQTPEAIQQDLEQRVAELNAVAAGLYDRWIEGLVH